MCAHDIETGAPPQDANGHAPPDPPRPSRHLGYLTWEWSVQLDYDGLTDLMDKVFALWDGLEGSGVMDNDAGDRFEAIIAHISRLRDFTGWGGVPGIYTGGEVNP